MTTYRRLLAVVAGERRWIALAALAAAVTLLAGVGLIATSAHLISESALVTSTATLALAITFVRLFAVLRAAGRYVERYVGHLGTFRILTRIRTWFFRSIVPLGPARLGDVRRGDLVARVAADVDTLQDFYLRVVVPPLAALAVSVAATGILWWLAPGAGLLLALALAFAAIGLPLACTAATAAPARKSVQARADRTATVVEGASAIGELLVLGAQDRWAEEVQRADDSAQHEDTRLAAVLGRTDATVALVQMAAAAGVLLIGVQLVAAGGLAGVQLAVLPLVALAAFEAVAPLAVAPLHVHRTRAAAERLFDLADEDPEVVDPPQPTAAPDGFDIDICDVSFRHRRAPCDAIDHLHMRIPVGSRLALVGRSGSGKSTLLSLLVRFHEFHHGSITLGGVDIRELRAADVRARICLVAQNDHLFDTSVRDNLLLAAPDATDDELWAALAVAELDGVVTALPAGLDERVGEGGHRLSGGERQRVMIARAVLAGAPVLLLDEATAHLDAATESQVLTNLFAARPGLTTVVVSHRAESLAGITRVVELHDPGDAEATRDLLRDVAE